MPEGEYRVYILEDDRETWRVDHISNGEEAVVNQSGDILQYADIDEVQPGKCTDKLAGNCIEAAKDDSFYVSLIPIEGEPLEFEFMSQEDRDAFIDELESKRNGTRRSCGCSSRKSSGSSLRSSGAGDSLRESGQTGRSSRNSGGSGSARNSGGSDSRRDSAKSNASQGGDQEEDEEDGDGDEANGDGADDEDGADNNGEDENGAEDDAGKSTWDPDEWKKNSQWKQHPKTFGWTKTG